MNVATPKPTVNRLATFGKLRKHGKTASIVLGKLRGQERDSTASEGYESPDGLRIVNETKIKALTYPARLWNFNHSLRRRINSGIKPVKRITQQRNQDSTFGQQNTSGRDHRQ